MLLDERAVRVKTPYELHRTRLTAHNSTSFLSVLVFFQNGCTNNFTYFEKSLMEKLLIEKL